MKCPECAALDIKSRVYGSDICMRTAMYSQPYYDEDGKYHNHDANTSTYNLSCSNGHKWTKSERGSCWCGWGKEAGDVRRDG